MKAIILLSGGIDSTTTLYLAKKQGEALERITYPKLQDEAISLGFYGAQTVLALSGLRLFEAIINDLAGVTSTPIHSFTADIGRASGSRDAKRMEKSLETVGQLGQYMPFQKGQIPTPTALNSPGDKD